MSFPPAVRPSKSRRYSRSPPRKYPKRSDLTEADCVRPLRQLRRSQRWERGKEVSRRPRARAGELPAMWYSTEEALKTEASSGFTKGPVETLLPPYSPMLSRRARPVVDQRP